jgi:hypothetical protein
MEKRQIVDGDHGPNRCIQRGDEIRAVQQVESKAHKFGRQQRLFQTMMHGGEQSGASKIRLLNQRRSMLAMLENDELVVVVEFC